MGQEVWVWEKRTGAGGVHHHNQLCWRCTKIDPPLGANRSQYTSLEPRVLDRWLKVAADFGSSLEFRSQLNSFLLRLFPSNSTTISSPRLEFMLAATLTAYISPLVWTAAARHPRGWESLHLGSGGRLASVKETEPSRKRTSPLETVERCSVAMMFINARPRFVSKGFEALVPTQRTEFLHQRLVEMTNNDVNAWSLFRPVATSTENWDQNLDDFSPEIFSVSCESKIKDIHEGWRKLASFFICWLLPGHAIYSSGPFNKLAKSFCICRCPLQPISSIQKIYPVAANIQRDCIRYELRRKSQSHAWGWLLPMEPGT